MTIHNELSQYNLAATPEELATLFEIIGGHPSAIKLACRQLETQSLADLIDAWQTNGSGNENDQSVYATDKVDYLNPHHQDQLTTVLHRACEFNVHWDDAYQVITQIAPTYENTHRFLLERVFEKAIPVAE